MTMMENLCLIVSFVYNELQDATSIKEVVPTREDDVLGLLLLGSAAPPKAAQCF